MKLNTIEQCDYRDFIPNIPDQSIDLLLCDPPYNASNSGLTSLSGDYKLVDQGWDKGFDPSIFVNMIMPKLKDNGQILIFCSYHLLGDYLNMRLLPKYTTGVNLTTSPKLEWKQILHWYKTNSMPSLTGKLYGFAVEYILWYVKGKEYTFDKIQRASYLNVFESHVGTYKVTEHEAEKPVGLFKQLIRTHSIEGDLVCDLFSGSGTTAVACVESSRNFIGCEIQERWVKVTNERLKNCNKQGELL
jgi:DNA modification methylase